MMERIEGHLSHISQCINATFQHSERIQTVSAVYGVPRPIRSLSFYQALVEVYCDLIEFCVEAQGVLSDNSEGKLSCEYLAS